MTKNQIEMKHTRDKKGKARITYCRAFVLQFFRVDLKRFDPQNPRKKSNCREGDCEMNLEKLKQILFFFCLEKQGVYVKVKNQTNLHFKIPGTVEGREATCGNKSHLSSKAKIKIQ